MRTITDASGSQWEVETISHGRTSRYLSVKVHRSVLQFTCLDGSLPRLYSPFPTGQGRTLDTLSDAELLAALDGARPY